MYKTVKYSDEETIIKKNTELLTRDNKISLLDDNVEDIDEINSSLMIESVVTIKNKNWTIER